MSNSPPNDHDDDDIYDTPMEMNPNPEADSDIAPESEYPQPPQHPLPGSSERYGRSYVVMRSRAVIVVELQRKWKSHYLCCYFGHVRLAEMPSDEQGPTFQSATVPTAGFGGTNMPAPEECMQATPAVFSLGAEFR